MAPINLDVCYLCRLGAPLILSHLTVTYRNSYVSLPDESPRPQPGALTICDVADLLRRRYAIITGKTEPQPLLTVSSTYCVISSESAGERVSS